MSYTNGFQTLVQSMNGLLTFNDGAGTVIENGNITTQSLSLNNIYATITNTSVSLWNNFTTGSVYLMTGMSNGYVYLATGLSAGDAEILYLGNEFCKITLGIFFIVGNSVQLGLGSTVDLFTNMVSGDICNIGSSTNTNNIGGIEIINRGINPKLKTANLSIGQLLSGSNVILGSSTISVIVSGFTFLGTSIQAGTTGTFNILTNLTTGTINLFTGITTGVATINLASNMAAGTLNIGKGGNINIGQATTGSLIKIDQNGLDTQVIIAPQQGATGSVSIGSTTNINCIGNLRVVGNAIIPFTTGQTMFVGNGNTTTMNIANNATTTTVGGTTCNVGNQNSALNYQLNLGTIGLNTGTNRVDIGVANTNTNILGGGVSLGVNTTGGYFYPSFLRLASGADNVDLFFRGASTLLNNTYETLIKSYSGSIWSGSGQGLQQTFCGQQEMIYNGSFTPRNLPTFNGIGMSYYSGSTNGAENATAISGYGPYGGIQLGGCGSSNNKGFSTTWGASLVTYPGYGTRFKNGGISFDNSNLTYSTGNDRGWVPISGVQSLQNLNVPAGGNVQQTISFGRTFSANPFITVTALMENINSNTDGLIITIYNVTTTGFSINAHNVVGSTNTNRWGYHWIGWAPY